MADRQKLPTYHMLVVVGVLLSNGKTYGQAIREKTGIGAGTLYPLLKRLEGAGIVLGIKEAGTPKNRKRPLRIYYEPTDAGKLFGVKYNATVLASNPRLVPFNEF